MEPIIISLIKTLWWSKNIDIEIYPKNIINSLGSYSAYLRRGKRYSWKFYQPSERELHDPGTEGTIGPLSFANFVARTSCSYNPRLNTIVPSHVRIHFIADVISMISRSYWFATNFFKFSFISRRGISCYRNDVKITIKDFLLSSCDIQRNIVETRSRCVIITF